MSSPLPPSGRWSEVDRAFDAALEREGAAREAWLDALAREDAAIAGAVRALLASADRPVALLDDPIAQVAAPLLAAADGVPAGARLGPWRLLAEIGRGGMGTVYLAERADEEFHKRVAIKVVKRGMDTDEVLRRFRQEREILAALEHPNVARLLDGGAGDDGRPYLVMEHVDGEPITAWCARRGAPVEARLQLFATACRAVQFAHRNLVVHRDIKPSNVLVTTAGEVKLVDFGIAKLLDGRDDAGAPLTRTGVHVLTPEYSAPEQRLGRPVTTATDVYALGVLLHELLTGRRPSDGDVAPPSAAVEGALRRRLRGDLDTIVRKALAPEPERRYLSAGDLADDVARHLEGRPVQARPATLGYRLRRFVGRHRAGVAAGVLLAALATGLGVYHDARIRRERALAERQRDKAGRVVGFLTEMLSAADPLRAQGDTITVLDVLARSERRLDSTLVAEPEVREELWRVIGATYRELGDYPRALRLLGRAHAEGRARRGARDSLVLETAADLAAVHLAMGRHDEAGRLTREVLAARRARHGEEHPLVAASLTALGELRWAQGDYTGAAEALERALAINRRTGAGAEVLAFTLNDLGAVLRSLGRNAEAGAALREALALRQRALGPNHPGVATSMLNVAAVARDAGDYAAAESLFRASLAIRRRAFGDAHAEVAGSMIGLAYTLQARRRYAPAESLFRNALAMNVRLLGARHPEVGMDTYALAALLHERGDVAEAELRYREAVAVLESAAGDAHPNTATARLMLGRLLVERGDAAGGERLLRRAAAARRAALGESHPQVAIAEADLGWSLARLGRIAEAESLLARGAAAWRPRPTSRDSAATRRMEWQRAEVRALQARATGSATR